MDQTNKRELSKLTLDIGNMSKILNSKGMNVNTGGKNEAFKNFQQRKASEASSAMGSNHSKSKSPPAVRKGGARGPMRPNQPNKNNKGEEAKDKAQAENDG